MNCSTREGWVCVAAAPGPVRNGATYCDTQQSPLSHEVVIAAVELAAGAAAGEPTAEAVHRY